MAFSPDGKRLASAAGVDGTVKVWDGATAQESVTLEGHTGPVWSVAFSPDGKRLASAGAEYGEPGEVKVWDAATAQELLTLKGHTGAVSSVAFSPDGLRLASASVDGTVKVWVAATGQQSLTLKGHIGEVLSVAFSPDGQRLASAGGYNDKTVKVWDAATGQESLALKGHASPVYCVAFSPDGQRLVSASGDRTVKLWNVATVTTIPELSGRTDEPESTSSSDISTAVPVEIPEVSDAHVVRPCTGDDRWTRSILGGPRRVVMFPVTRERDHVTDDRVPVYLDCCYEAARKCTSDVAQVAARTTAIITFNCAALDAFASWGIQTCARLTSPGMPAQELRLCQRFRGDTEFSNAATESLMTVVLSASDSNAGSCSAERAAGSDLCPGGGNFLSVNEQALHAFLVVKHSGQMQKLTRWERLRGTHDRCIVERVGHQKSQLTTFFEAKEPRVKSSAIIATKDDEAPILPGSRIERDFDPRFDCEALREIKGLVVSDGDSVIVPVECECKCCCWKIDGVIQRSAHCAGMATVARCIFQQL